MRRDERDLPVSTDSDLAVERLDRAVEHYLKGHADMGRLLNEALAADPGFALAQVFRGYMLLAAANPANAPAIAATLTAAEAAAATATPREQRHVAAFAAWARGAVDDSFRIWRRILDDDPTDLMAVRICDTIWFRHGQTAAIREQADRLAPAWDGDRPGRECFLSVWAFAHEETGDYAAAEAAIDTALAVDRPNFFAHHVKAHVMEMTCRPQAGADWLASQSDTWGIGGNFVHHLWWHRDLMLLELGEREAVLADYDQHIRNLDEPLTRALPDFYVDLQNAASLLWRLEYLGVPVGARWAEIADKAEARCGEAAHLLLVPHLLQALAATGRWAVADRYLAALREAAADPALWTAPALAQVVIPVCEAVLAHRRGAHAAVVERLAPIGDAFRPLGGSNAQRDMFTWMLLDSAIHTGRRDLVGAVLAQERATRSVPPERRAGFAAAAQWLG
jgi:tetratricopeptide (TPR) repeat protein